MDHTITIDFEVPRFSYDGIARQGDFLKLFYGFRPMGLFLKRQTRYKDYTIGSHLNWSQKEGETEEVRKYSKSRMLQFSFQVSSCIGMHLPLAGEMQATEEASTETSSLVKLMKYNTSSAPIMCASNCCNFAINICPLDSNPPLPTCRYLSLQYNVIFLLATFTFVQEDNYLPTRFTQEKLHKRRNNNKEPIT